MTTARDVLFDVFIPEGFSGSILLRSRGEVIVHSAGWRDRANRLAVDAETAFGIASGTKGFTAVAVARLVEDGAFSFHTPVASLGDGRLDFVPEDVTVAHLLTHSSGIGDYLDEDEIEDVSEVALAIPVNRLVSPLDYLPMIAPLAPKFPAGSRFSYCNSGYVVLAMIIELVAGMPYGEAAMRLVFDKAGMMRSGFFRSDELPANAALGYIEPYPSTRTNQFILPVVGGGDGGAFTTPADMDRFWRALFAGALLSKDTLAQLMAPTECADEANLGYGKGFWLDEEDGAVILMGTDAGVSFHSRFYPATGDGFTVVSNMTTTIRPVVCALKGVLAEQTGTAHRAAMMPDQH